MRAFCTVVSISHLRAAYALAISLQVSGNSESLHILVIDATTTDLPASRYGEVLHALDELTGRLPALMPFYYDAFELCNSLKPFFVSELLASGIAEVIYLDSDIYVVSSFQPAWAALQSTSLLMTPHQLEPPPLQQGHLNEKDIVDMGIYNGGFSAWKNNEKTQRILGWMCERFPVYAFNRRSRGMFVDQKLLPLIPVYFPDDVTIWREPRLNVAYWNSHERQIAFSKGRFLLDGEPIMFFHLSGFRIYRPDVVCVYLSSDANTSILATAPWLRRVLSMYTELVLSIRDPLRAQEYSFSRFKSFTLTPRLREILFARGDLSLRQPAVWRALIADHLRMLKRRLFKIFHV